MKQYKYIFLAILATFWFACEEDGMKIIVSDLAPSTLVANTDDIVLTQDNAADVGLTLSWSKEALGISDTTVGIPDGFPLMMLEAAVDDSFATVSASQGENYSKTFGVAELNTIATHLGVLPYTKTPLYFRVSAVLGNNIDPVYSNVVTVDVTTFTIDMSFAKVLDSDLAETGQYLSSPNSDGEYFGFMGASGWGNFYLLEGDGALWGNYGADGYEFVLDNTDGRWNFWFPGQTGCYYTTISVDEKEWTANYISSLSLSGDVVAEMVYDKSSNMWSVPFTTTTDNASFTVTGVSALYNKTTGTDDASAISGSVSFAPAADGLVLFNEIGSFIAEGVAGNYTLTINLSNPKAWTYSITSGTVVIEDPISKFLYLPGIDDGISGSWTFDNYLDLIREEDSTFAGVVNVNSLWGYNMGLEIDNWDDVYKMASGDAYSGTLGFQAENAIAAPDPNVYLIKADLANSTYSLSNLASQIFVTGLNDVWDFSVPLSMTSDPGVYSGSVTISGDTPWGYNFLLFQDNWDEKFGGAEDHLRYGADNIEATWYQEHGTYTMTVDLVNGICTVQ